MTRCKHPLPHVDLSCCIRFEGKLLTIIEHFHSVFLNIDSRMRAEQFKVVHVVPALP